MFHTSHLTVSIISISCFFFVSSLILEFCHYPTFICSLLVLFICYFMRVVYLSSPTHRNIYWSPGLNTSIHYHRQTIFVEWISYRMQTLVYINFVMFVNFFLIYRTLGSCVTGVLLTICVMNNVTITLLYQGYVCCYKQWLSVTWNLLKLFKIHNVGSFSVKKSEWTKIM